MYYKFEIETALITTYNFLLWGEARALKEKPLLAVRRQCEPLNCAEFDVLIAAEKSRDFQQI